MVPVMKCTKISLLFSAIVFCVSPVWADSDSERANLANLVAELDSLSNTLTIYQINSLQDRRYLFDYDALSQDLQAMRSGIVEYINKDLSMAREIPPLSGQYTKQRGGE